MNDTLQIRSYQAGDEVHILDLFRCSYGYDLREDYWIWRFKNNPAGPGIIDMTWNGATPAAHYAVTLAVMRIHGGDWLTGLSGTTMAHPDYRGCGLFQILARSMYTRMAAMGVAMVWGFPNAQSHRGFVRGLNWADIYKVPMFRLPLTLRAPVLSVPPQVAEITVVDERFDRLWACVRDDYAVIARRDRAHLQWRYLDNPAERYHVIAYEDGGEVLGYAVLKRYRAEWQVIDLLAIKESTEVGEGLIAFVVQRAVSEGAEAISLWLNLTHPLYHALEKIGFRPDVPITYLGGLALQPELDTRLLYDYRQWYLTMGDSDVF
jgi:hypothetical protein